METSIRRHIIEELTDSEKAIHNAIQDVEKMPADENLTKAITLLSDAQEIVANYVDAEFEAGRVKS